MLTILIFLAVCGFLGLLLLALIISLLDIRQNRRFAATQQQLRQAYEQEQAQKQAQKKQEKILRMNEHRQKRDKLRRDAQDALDFLRREVFVCGLVIDSNIWMNEQYENIFAVLDWLGKQGYGAKASRSLILQRVQFDEICLKKDSTEFKSHGNIAARIAIRRIEQLQTKHLLTVDAGYKAQREEGDPALLRLMSSMLADGKPVRLVTDDVELRIRTREILGRQPAAQWKLIGVEDIIPKCNTILAACKVGASPSSRKEIRT